MNLADVLPRSHVFVIDPDVTRVTLADCAAIAPGLQAQLREDVSPEWGTSPLDVVRADSDVTPPADGEIEIQIHAQAPADEQGALALHSNKPDGTPIIHVFDDLLAQFGVTLSSAVSHETCEAAADPQGDRTATLLDGRVCAVEIADQVEALSYQKLGVEVSDFNTRSNFGIDGNDPPYDKMGKQTSQFQVLDGGYAQILTDQGWQQLSSNMRAYRAELDKRGLSRTAKRQRKHGKMISARNAAWLDLQLAAHAYASAEIGPLRFEARKRLAAAAEAFTIAEADIPSIARISGWKT